ncbi:transposase [Fulvivirgaceae bacterium LMO-SS25]
MHYKPKYNPKIHKRKSIRLKGYDYSQAGLYFITICCQDKLCRFGQVVNGEMVLNDFGLIAYNEWLKTPEIRPNVELGEFVIMPNHMHGIIHILYRDPSRKGESHSPDNTQQKTDERDTSSAKSDVCDTSSAKREQNPNRKGESHSPYNTQQKTDERDTTSRKSDAFNTSPPESDVCDTSLQSPSQTIGAIVRGYKSAVTKQLKSLGFHEKLWQRNYYERIIRDERAYHNISKYIINNPRKWSEDKFCKK